MNLRVLYFCSVLEFHMYKYEPLISGIGISVLFLNLKDVNFVLCEGDVVIVKMMTRMLLEKEETFKFFVI